jgi:hypothetical protein
MIERDFINRMHRNGTMILNHTTNILDSHSIAYFYYDRDERRRSIHAVNTRSID